MQWTYILPPEAEVAQGLIKSLWADPVHGDSTDLLSALSQLCSEVTGSWVLPMNFYRLGVVAD